MLQRARVYTHGAYNYYFGSLDGTMHNALRSTKAGGSRTAWMDCVFCTQSAYDWVDNMYPYDARLYRWCVQVLQRAVRCYNALQCLARRYNARYEVTTCSTIVWSYNVRYNVPTRGTMLWHCTMLQCAVRCYNNVTMRDTMFQRAKFWGLARSQRAFGKVRRVWIDLRFMARICALCGEWRCVWTIAFGWGRPVSGILV